MENKSIKSSAIRSPLAIGAAIGTGAGLLFLAYSFLTAFGICSDISAAETLFPYSMLIGLSVAGGWPMFIIALIQYPLYGTIIGGVFSLTGWLRYLAIMALFFVVVFHYTAVIEAQQSIVNLWGLF